MTLPANPEFNAYFEALNGHPPFPWQRMLAVRLVEGNWPTVIDLPTAAGKTTCIDISVWALAAQAEREPAQRTAPRRTWFVVDRRIVVDEAFERACRIADALVENKSEALRAVAERLCHLSGTRRPLAVGRLRGGVFRDESWAQLPSQPAVITSTVDQFGSRLLFRGYGRSHLVAPVFAGLAGNDSLVVLDEAHCSVPFMQTLNAVRVYRGAKWAEQPVTTPFSFTVLSATPPRDTDPDDVFPGSRRQEALDHEELRRRVNAAKPAVLHPPIPPARHDSADPLPPAAAAEAKRLVREHGKQRVAVVVNRVAAAGEIATLLQRDDALGSEVDIVLLTGRVRPLERDLVIERWKPILRAAAPAEPHRPIVVVATQCIEVGADFSFDALVTEVASLDALRQRFGRLNRLGNVEDARATILVRKSDLKAKGGDPVYGGSLAATWALLEAHASPGSRKKDPKTVDFGIAKTDALLETLDADTLEACLAPAPDAPSLLPAHLDLLCQTSPVPHPNPDVSLYLHGVDRSTPEVRVAWRTDLDSHSVGTWIETVSLCPPVSGETLAVPLHRLHPWLRGRKPVDAEDNTADVEGGSFAEEDGGDIPPALVWAGRDRSRVVRNNRDLLPNDLVVLPASYGMVPAGQVVGDRAVGTESLDLWEAARIHAGKPPAVRITRRVLAPWLEHPAIAALVEAAHDPEFDPSRVVDAITDVTTAPGVDEDQDAPPEWLLRTLAACRKGRIEQHPGGGVTLFAPAAGRPVSAEEDRFADDDELRSAAGREVDLDTHSELVRRTVKRLATRCLDDGLHAPLIGAALWHDVGKLDPRFQLYLRGGESVDDAHALPLAKSRAVPVSPGHQRTVRALSGLPEHFRHEMLSLRIAERHEFLPAADGDEKDLALHLISSHHGHGRPFAPVSIDTAPPDIDSNFAGTPIALSSETRAASPPLHHLDATIPRRFWRLNRRFGWWGLAYLEAIVRLGDWYGSQLDADVLSPKPSRVPLAALPAASAVAAGTELTGIDGANPLGFLTALGTVELLHKAGYSDVRLSWHRAAVWRPKIHCPALDSAEVLTEAVTRQLEREPRHEIELGTAANPAMRVLDPDTALYRDCVFKALKCAGPVSRTTLDYLAAFCSDGALDLDSQGKARVNKRKLPRLKPTPFAFTTGSGHQYFFGNVVKLAEHIDKDRIYATLFRLWQRKDQSLSLRWDPVDDRRYALIDQNPEKLPALTDWMANLLAYRALPLFPASASRYGLVCTAWSRDRTEPAFTWPIWSAPIDLPTIISLLTYSGLIADRIDHRTLREIGVMAVYRARRIRVGTGANFKFNFTLASEV